jgi:hypothetical protein
MAASNASAARAAPHTSQRSCWRSIPWARPSVPQRHGPDDQRSQDDNSGDRLGDVQQPTRQERDGERVLDGRVLRIQRCRVNDRSQ